MSSTAPRKPLPNELVTLRIALDGVTDSGRTEHSTTTTQEQQPQMPLLRWLRTTIALRGDVEQHRTALRLLPQTMIEHVVLDWEWSATDCGSDVPLGIVLETVLSMPCLIGLDLRWVGYNIGKQVDRIRLELGDSFLMSIAKRHPRLRRLYLPFSSCVSQSCLDTFRHLEELAITGCMNINNVHFCASTLRVLYANYSPVDDAGLANAVHLEVLHVIDCRGVRSVAPFAATLRDLVARGGCGISDSSLMCAASIERLNVTENTKITTLRPFRHSLKELIAVGRCGLTDSSLAEATCLVKLSVYYNETISYVPPSVRELTAPSSQSRVTDSSLVHCTSLVYLNVWGNPNVTSLQPFAASLRYLDARGNSGITNEAIAVAQHLVHLDTSRDPNVTVKTERDSSGYLRIVVQEK